MRTNNLNTPLRIGDRVRLRDSYLDPEMTRPVTGVVCDVFDRPDWGERWGQTVAAHAVLFDHDDPGFPPGGEFSYGALELISHGTPEQVADFKRERAAERAAEIERERAAAQE
jgi:hypothetical protein